LLVEGSEGAGYKGGGFLGGAYNKDLAEAFRVEDSKADVDKRKEDKEDREGDCGGEEGAV
jgi:hypothetical protein